MKRTTNIVFVVLSIMIFLLGFFVVNSQLDASIENYTLIRISNALIYGAGSLAVIFLVLLFTPSAYTAWKKFAAWFIPVAVILFIIWPDGPTGFFSVTPPPEQVFKWVSVLYVLVSLAIIAKNVGKNRPE